MSLNIEIDSYDYNQAVLAVQKMLDRIKAIPVTEEEAELENIPDASDIVDVIWDCIK